MEVQRLEGLKTIGHLHDGVILLLRPESFGFLLSCANYRLCYFNLAGMTKFKCERKHEKNSAHTSKMTPSCKWPIAADVLAAPRFRVQQHLTERLTQLAVKTIETVTEIRGLCEVLDYPRFLAVI